MAVGRMSDSSRHVKTQMITSRVSEMGKISPAAVGNLFSGLAAIGMVEGAVGLLNSDELDDHSSQIFREFILPRYTARSYNARVARACPYGHLKSATGTNEGD